MSDLVKSGDGNIITLLHRGQQPVNPFPKPIFLFSSHIARTTYIDNIDELAPCLVEDKGLSLFREPQKPHDEKAVAVYDGADRIAISLRMKTRSSPALWTRESRFTVS